MKTLEDSRFPKHSRLVALSLVSVCLIFFVVVGALAFDQLIVTDGDKSLKLKDPRIVVSKSERKLELFDGDKLIKKYKIALGKNPVGDKEVEGDGKTPEGEFYIFTKNPQSKFYLSIGVSYPSIDDAKRGLEKKLITREVHDDIVEAIRNKKMPPQKTPLGGEIYIHGMGNLNDWTEGCVALKNSDMKELYEKISVGAKVVITS